MTAAIHGSRHTVVESHWCVSQEQAFDLKLIMWGAAASLASGLQYYADDVPPDDPEDFDANRAALGLRSRPRKVCKYMW